MRRAALVSFGVACFVTLGLVYLGLPTAFPLRPTAERSTLRVVVANLAFDNKQSVDVTAVIERLDPDVLVALEWTGTNLQLAVVGAPRRRVAIDAPHDGAHGVLVLLRDGLMAMASLVPSPVAGPCGMPFATIRLRLGNRWVSVLGVHAPPQIDECAETNEPTLTYLAELVEDGRLQRGIGVARRGDPLILLGDLNATPNSDGVAGLRRGLVDAQADRSWLPTGTWSRRDVPLSFERIDYVMIADEIAIDGAWTVRLPGSDHRAVVVDAGPIDGRR